MLDIQKKAMEMARVGHLLARRIKMQDTKLGNQLNAATTGLVLNLNEGIGRTRPKDKRFKYDIAFGECKESQSAAMLAVACGYVENADEFLELADEVGAMLYCFREALSRW